MLPTANRIPEHLSGFDVMALNMLGPNYVRRNSFGHLCKYLLQGQ